jgi:hypothetical protein
MRYNHPFTSISISPVPYITKKGHIFTSDLKKKYAKYEGQFYSYFAKNIFVVSCKRFRSRITEKSNQQHIDQ